MRYLINYFNLLILLLLAPLCELYKILVVMPIPIKSHAIMGHAFVKLLLEAGHEVTYITGLPCNNSYPNFHEIDISREDKLSENMMDKHILKGEMDRSNPKHFSQLVTTLFSLTLQHAEVNMLLKDTSQRFDLVIAEWLFNEVYTGYLYNLEKKAFMDIFEPLMALRKKSLRSYDESRYIASLALVNSHASLDLDTSWPQNLKLIAGFHIDQDVEPLPKDLKSIMDNARHGVIYFSMGSYMDSKDISELSSLDLIDMFSKLKQIVIWKLDLSFTKLPRNVHILKWAPQQSILGQLINIAALMSHQVEMDQDSLFKSSLNLAKHTLENEAVQKLLNDASEEFNVVVAEWLFNDIYCGFSAVFNCPYIWSFPLEPNFVSLGFLGEATNPAYTANIQLNDVPPFNFWQRTYALWFQVSTHPNCILFITHGGLLSTTEAVHFAVPFIGIPVYYDQNYNVEQSVQRGIAKKVSLTNNIDKDLRVAIKEILNDPKYYERIKETSFVYHHRPVPPGKELVHWVEHVVRTRGAPLHRSPARLVPWYQKMFLDLIALIVVFVFVLLQTIKFMLRCISRHKVPYKKKVT